MTWRHGVVRSLGRSWTGAQELTVQLLGDDEPLEVRALAYPDLVGVPSPGERVLLNTTAQQRGLGTGGYALVVARPDHLPNDPPAGDRKSTRLNSSHVAISYAVLRLKTNTTH